MRANESTKALKFEATMRSQENFDLSLSLQQPANVYSGDCVRILASLKSEQLVHFEMNLPHQAAYDVVACERIPLRLVASHYHQSIEWTVQVKAPGSIQIPPLQADIRGIDHQHTLTTKALTIEVQTYAHTLYDSKALELPNIEPSMSERPTIWLLIPLVFIGLIALAIRLRKQSKTESEPSTKINSAAKTGNTSHVFTPEIAAYMLSKIPSKSPNELRVHLESLAYQKMSPSQRRALTETAKAYLKA
jgi:hypothetical protein